MLTFLHVLTHIGLGWIVAGVASLSVRDRWIVVLAGILLDLDGAGLVWSEDAYLAAHRALGHGLLFLVLMVIVALRCADAPRTTAILAAVSFHMHLFLDLVGTGGLPIRYFWPFSDWGWSYDGRWALASWQNVVVMIVVALGVLVVEWRRRRTRPVAHTSPSAPPVERPLAGR